MAIANYNEEKPFILFTFKKFCNGEQRLAAQQSFSLTKQKILTSNLFQMISTLKKIKKLSLR